MPAVLRALQQAQVGDTGEGGTRADGPRMRAAVARLLAPFAHSLLVLDNAESVAGQAETTTAIADLLAPFTGPFPYRHLAGAAWRGWRTAVIRIARCRLPIRRYRAWTPKARHRRGMPCCCIPASACFWIALRHARLGFALSDENRDIIAALCARLEGMPLAIELCAAWATTLSPPEMLAALDDRFDLLVSRRADVPPRHRSLYAAIESSYLAAAA